MTYDKPATALGVVCPKCGETIFLFHGERPGLTHQVDLSLFTFAVGPHKGESLAKHQDKKNCPANGCELAYTDMGRVFDPRQWNEIRIDAKSDRA